MSSLKDRIELLENDLKAVPSRISVYHDLPFAILRYDPGDEWELRREINWLGTRLENVGKEVSTSRCRSFSGRRSTRPRGWMSWSDLERQDGLPPCPRSGYDLSLRQGFQSACGDAGRAIGLARSQKIRRLPDQGGGDVAGSVPHVQTAGRNEGQDPYDHDPVLPRLPRRQYGTPVHGPP